MGCKKLRNASGQEGISKKRWDVEGLCMTLYIMDGYPGIKMLKF